MNKLNATQTFLAILAGIAFLFGSPVTAGAFEPCQEIEAAQVDRKKVPGFENLNIEYLSAHQISKTLYLVVGKKLSEQDILRIIFLEVVTGEPFPMLEKSIEGQCYKPIVFSCPEKDSIVSLGLGGCDVPREVHVLVKRGENDYKEAGIINLVVPPGEMDSDNSAFEAAVSQLKRNFKIKITQNIQPVEGDALTQQTSYTYSGGELKQD